MMIGTAVMLTLPLYIENSSHMSLAFKSIFVLSFIIYFIESLLSIIGCYILLIKKTVNLPLLLTAIIYCIEISANNIKFTFLPFDFYYLIKFNFGDIILGVGLNFLGVIFIFWWIMLKKISRKIVIQNENN
jgi:hypothetical protein